MNNRYLGGLLFASIAASSLFGGDNINELKLMQGDGVFEKDGTTYKKTTHNGKIRICKIKKIKKKTVPKPEKKKGQNQDKKVDKKPQKNTEILVENIQKNTEKSFFDDPKFISIGFGKADIDFKNKIFGDFNHTPYFVDIKAGITKKNMHNLTVGISIGQNIDEDNRKIEIITPHIGYDFFIKNLNSNTGLSVGAEVGMPIVNFEERVGISSSSGSVTEVTASEVAIGFNAFAKIAFFQDFLDDYTAEISYKIGKNFVYGDFVNVEKESDISFSISRRF